MEWTVTNAAGSVGFYATHTPHTPYSPDTRHTGHGARMSTRLRGSTCLGLAGSTDVHARLKSL